MLQHTREQVLGGLAHRAALMPFAKPGTRPGRILADLAKENAAVLAAALEYQTPLNSLLELQRPNILWQTWKLEECLVDGGGPYWPKLAGDFHALDLHNQHWVLHRLVLTSERLGHALDSLWDERKWHSLWSEVPLWERNSNGEPALTRDPETDHWFPKLTRPDFVALRTNRGVDLVELATTSGRFHAKIEEKANNGCFDTWEELLAPVKVRQWFVVVASTDPNRRQSCWAWEDVTP